MPSYTPISKLGIRTVVLVTYRAIFSCIYDLLSYFSLKIFSENLKTIGLTLHPQARIVGSLNTENFQISGDVFIGMFTVLAIGSDERGGAGTGSIIFGNKVYVGDQCNLRATGGELRIGSNVLIANHVTMVASNHGYRLGSPICNQPWSDYPLGVTIEDECWIGAHATLLPGSYISKGAIIAAGAVVNCHVPPEEIWGGIPAKRISIRK